MENGEMVRSADHSIAVPSSRFPAILSRLHRGDLSIEFGAPEAARPSSGYLFGLHTAIVEAIPNTAELYTRFQNTTLLKLSLLIDYCLYLLFNILVNPII